MFKRFILRIMLFVFPFFLILLAVLHLAHHVGYFLSLEDIVRIQQDADPFIIFDTPFLSQRRYKTLSIEHRQPSVLIVGSSRSLSFRADFCNLSPQSFYNAGVRTLDVETMTPITQAFIEAHRPDVLLLLLDQPSFNASYTRFWPSLFREEEFSPLSMAGVHDFIQSNNLFVLNFQLTFEKWTALYALQEPVYHREALGTFAILKGVGFRADGSTQNGLGELDVDYPLLGQTFAVREEVFEHGDAVNEAAMQSLDELLAYASERNIEVIGFFPPFRPSEYEQYFSELTITHPYLDLATSALTDLFESYDYSFHDFTDPTSLDIRGETMLDAWHMSERSSLMLYLELLESHPDILGQCSEASGLEAALENSEHPFLIFPPYYPDSYNQP